MIMCMDIVNNIKKALKIHEVDVCFDKVNVFNEIANNRKMSFAYFSVINNEAEKDRYEKKTQNAKNIYKTKSPMIHIIDVSENEFVLWFSVLFPEEYQITVEMLEKQFGEKFDKRMILPFIFLHEVGHWNQLMSMGRTVKSYIDMDLVEEQKNFSAQSKLYNRLKNNENGKANIEEQKKLLELKREYRKIKKEAEADQYAISQIAKLDLNKVFIC